MASEKQVEAKRANAKKSTGPKTEQGKARSRANAWKHGLTAEMLVIGGEATEEFEELRARLMMEQDPQSQFECELVERLAGIFWRLRRAPFFETAIIDARQAQLDHEARRTNFKMPYRTPQEFEGDEDGAVEMSAVEWSIYVGSALIQDSVFGDTLGKVSRYEAALMKALSKTMEVLQENKAKKLEPVPLKAVSLSVAA